ncbi:MAG: hypothetical protein WCH43_09645 [Verrucomicrobiota bacterium]
MIPYDRILCRRNKISTPVPDKQANATEECSRGRTTAAIETAGLLHPVDPFKESACTNSLKTVSNNTAKISRKKLFINPRIKG